MLAVDLIDNHPLHSPLPPNHTTNHTGFTLPLTPMNISTMWRAREGQTEDTHAAVFGNCRVSTTADAFSMSFVSTCSFAAW
jgi:hypothetical protein